MCLVGVACREFLNLGLKLSDFLLNAHKEISKDLDLISFRVLVFICDSACVSSKGSSARLWRIPINCLLFS